MHLNIGNLKSFKNVVIDYIIYHERETKKVKDDMPTVTYIEDFDYLKKEFGVHVVETRYLWFEKAKELVEGTLKEQYSCI
ncbi:hypothetical protein CR513_52264, partial [Mucuna pruriens]